MNVYRKIKKISENGKTGKRNNIAEHLSSGSLVLHFILKHRLELSSTFF
jgi:hypothetical protein